jgi:hypothetical protein
VSHSKNTRNLLDPILDVLLNRLLHDKNFRKKFFESPPSAVEKLGIKLEPETIAFLRNFRRSQVSKDIAIFDEKLVLCSAAPD